MVPPAALHDDNAPATLRQLLRFTRTSLSPTATIREALDLFEKAEADALAVTTPDRRVVGILSEAHAIRRYSDEMGRRLSELTGERLD